MSNRNPRQTGITKYWKPGEDDRGELLSLVRLEPGTRRATRGHVDGFLRSLWSMLGSRRRTKFVGFGVFEWKPYRRRLPTGRMVETWRLAFKPSRYTEKYDGGAE